VGEKLLYQTVREGTPLIEFTFEFAEGVDPVSATDRLNVLAEDFHIDPKPLHDDPMHRIGSATKESLERLFGWQLGRKLTAPGSGTYLWTELSPPLRLPPEFKSIGLSQPGADDDGQWYE
jgi:hypothetical protein